MKYLVQTFFDQPTFTLTYIVYDPNSGDALIIDPVLDYDPASSKVFKESLNQVLDFVNKNNLKPKAVLETHAHADHLTSAQEIKSIFPEVIVGIGSKITMVQDVFKGVYNLEHFIADGSQFDMLLEDEQVVKFGTIEVKTIATPGHTPACVSYLIEDKIFTGDALFMPDFGTGRCDFPAGSATDLYHSIQKLYQLPDETKIFTGHDYQPGGRALKFESTIGESKKENIQLKGETTEAEFVSFRTARDQKLKAPRLLLPSIQVNIDGGRLPNPEANEVSYLKIPLNLEK